MPLSGALAGLSAAPEGYQRGRILTDQADISDFAVGDAKRASLAKVAMGNALALLSGAPGLTGAPPGPQPPAPGQPSQPMQQAGAMPTPSPPAPMGPMPPQGGPPMMPPQGGQPMPGSQQPMMPRPVQTQSIPGQGPAPFAARFPQQAMPQAPFGGGGQDQANTANQGPLDWKQLVAATKQANPGIKPDVLAEVVNQFMPLMSMQSKQEWQQISLQLREQSILAREQTARMMEEGRNNRTTTLEAGRNQRAELSANTKQQMQSLSQAARQELEELRQQGRMELADVSHDTRLELAKLNTDAKRELFQDAEQGRNDRLERTERGRDDRLRTTEEGKDRRVQERGTSGGSFAQKSYTEWKQIPGNESKTRPDYEKELSAARRAGAPTATELKQKDRGRTIDAIQAQINSAYQDVASSFRGGKNVTGVFGSVNRLREIAENITGLSDDTQAETFQGKMVLLKPQILRILTGSARVTKAEIDGVNQAFRGLSPGSTRQNTAKALNHIANVLEMYRPEGSAPAKGGTAPAKSNDGWTIERIEQ